MKKIQKRIFLVLIALVFMSSGHALADTYGTDFESFVLGNVNGQDGWTSGGQGAPCGIYDVAVVSNTYGYSSMGTKALRISNAVTCGSFNDHTFSKSLANEAGETSASTSVYSGGTRQPYFEAQWDFASTQPGSEQAGLSVVASPDRGDPSRMSWVQMQDTSTGLQLNFQDYDRSLSNFVLTPIATNLDRTVPYTVKMTIQFIDGPSNDIVKVYLNGTLIHTGRTWEDYYRDLGNVPAPVDSIMFRVAGTAAPATAGKGFIIDNFSSVSGPVPTQSTTYNTSFDSLTPGSINGQDGWGVTGAYDQAVVANTYGYGSFGTQSFRISNAVTSGSFGDQTFSQSLPNDAGESTAQTSTYSGGTRQPHFEAQFDLASTVPSAQQAGMSLSVSPDPGSGARMSYLRFVDQVDGIHVYFDDYQDAALQGTLANPANGCGVEDDFVETDIATLDRSVAHTIKFAIDFLEGPANDQVNIYIDGSLAHTGTTWEDYYRWCTESGGGVVGGATADVSRAVDSLLFREGGTAVPGNLGKGFLIDNFSTMSGPSSLALAPSFPNTGDVAVNFPRSLGFGSRGADVAALQTILVQKGFLRIPPGVAKGFFGPLTQAAISKYQASVGLRSVSVFGPLTRARLISELRNNPVFGNIKPSSRVGSSPSSL